MNEEYHQSALLPAEGEPVVVRVNRNRSEISRTSMQLSLAQLQRLVDEFDLGRIIQMDTPTDTQCNTTEPFKTGRGTFLLRARHGDEFIERVEYIHKMMDVLRKKGFLLPEVMRTPEGAGCIVWGERIVEIHRFIPHDNEIHRGWDQMNAAAVALAKLHQILDQEKPSNVLPVSPELRNDIGPMQIYNILNRSDASLQEAVRSIPNADKALEVVREAIHAVVPIIEQYERHVGSLPWLIVHGDYHFWNILYKGNEIVGVVDYDFLQERERLFDIAYALQSVITYLGATHTQDLYDYSELNWKKINQWVNLYDQHTHLPLTRQERAWLPSELLRIFLINICTASMGPTPVEDILQQVFELRLYRWIYQQTDLFTG